ncbi:geranylgeranyl transferase type-1 subunit beta [Onthophagus taurus]|uniref:geranylgeranyl transferase type-1 subunit beta n=1 Tax=Onthophagus taurus TaxID=166361 RepID=UPI0039BDE08A
MLELNHRAHKKYLKRFLQMLPAYGASYDSTRVVIAYFSISGLDILQDIENLTEDYKKKIIDWVYSLQVINDEELASGFQGSSSLNTLENKDKPAPYKWGHVASTYTALCILLILGDDLSRVNKPSLLRSLRSLQQPNGVFSSFKEGSESDMRFIYCAACICYILDDWSGIDIEKTTKYILNSFTYESAFAQGPDLEAHGGSSFCAIAALSLMNKLSILNKKQKDYLVRWLIMRQKSGFQGRPDKEVDTCYSFWIGASLKILNAFDCVNFEENRTYILMTQEGLYGGFSKWVNTQSDPLHTYMGLAGLSLMKENGLNEVMPLLNISCRAYNHLKELHKKWMD